MGTRLSHFREKWRTVSSDPWVLGVISEGLRLEFQTGYPFPSGTRITPLSGDASKNQALESEVRALFKKGAIELVPEEEKGEGYYSTYFLTPKKTGDWRPILNLKVLNRTMVYHRFRMETIGKMVKAIQPGRWLASIDLKDAYFHIPVFPAHRRFLRFAFLGCHFQFRAMPFGLTSAPRIFTKVMAEVAQHLHAQGIHCYPYIDDLLIVGPDRNSTAHAVERTLELLISLGWVINRKKSDFNPSQDLVFIGARFQTKLGLVSLPEDRLQALLECTRDLWSRSMIPARTYLRMLGLMAACKYVVRFCMLRMRPLQRYLAQHWRPIVFPISHPIPLGQDFRDHILWWTVEENLTVGLLLDPVPPQVTITCDASLDGWGAVMDRDSASGRWTAEEASLHINWLEMEAIRRAISLWLPKLKGLTVRVESDSMTAVQYIRREGGTKSPSLCSLTWDLLLLCQEHQISLFPVHVPGTQNLESDSLSRTRWTTAEWELSNRVVQWLFSLWGSPHIDEFASTQNHKLPVFCSRTFCSKTFHVDALSMDWGSVIGYAFPPLALIPLVLRKLLRDKTPSLILNPDSSSLETPLLVPSPAGSLDRGPNSPSPSEPLPPDQNQSWSPAGHRAGRLEVERNLLAGSGIPQEIAEVIVGSRRASTRECYARHWQTFVSWCTERDIVPVSAPVPSILEFLHSHFRSGKAPNTIGVMLASISAYHLPMGGRSVGHVEAISRYLKGLRIARPIVRSAAPPWDLASVLLSLTQSPFEPMASCDLKFLTWKTIFLLAIASARRVSELQALSCDPPFTILKGETASLRTVPSFLPKAATHWHLCQSIELNAFFPHPERKNRIQQTWHTQCPVRALRFYLDRYKEFRKSRQLFVLYGRGKEGDPASKATIGRWLVEAINQAYSSLGKGFPKVVHAHQTRAVASTWAEFAKCDPSEIMRAGLWSSHSTFVQHYRLNMALEPHSNFGSSVLQAASSAGAGSKQ